MGKHSIVRYKAIESCIKSSLSKITKDNLKEILSTTMPEGVCCHHYADGMGTLWSMIFDLMEMEVNICFGSPNVNEWKTFNLNSPMGITDYFSTLPNESTDPDFWKPITISEE